MIVGLIDLSILGFNLYNPKESRYLWILVLSGLLAVLMYLGDRFLPEDYIKDGEFDFWLGPYVYQTAAALKTMRWLWILTGIVAILNYIILNYLYRFFEN